MIFVTKGSYTSGTASNLLNHLNSQHPSTTVKGADRYVFNLKKDGDYINMFKKTIYKKFLVIEGQAIIYMTEIIAWHIL